MPPQSPSTAGPRPPGGTPKARGAQPRLPPGRCPIPPDTDRVRREPGSGVNGFLPDAGDPDLEAELGGGRFAAMTSGLVLPLDVSSGASFPTGLGSTSLAFDPSACSGGS